MKQLLCLNESRGRDASGIATTTREGIGFLKGPFPASELVTKEEFQKFPLGPIGMIHARTKTLGTQFENVNNHPVIFGDWVVVHNGMIVNHEEVFRKLQSERTAEVDTVAIPALMSVGRTVQESINLLPLLEGGATIAAISCKYASTVVLMKHTNPLYIIVNDKLLIWSSVKEAFDCFPAEKLFGIWKQVVFTDVDDDTTFIITPGGIEKRKLDFPSTWERKDVDWEKCLETRDVKKTTGTTFAKESSTTFSSKRVLTGKKNKSASCYSCKKQFVRNVWTRDIFTYVRNGVRVFEAKCPSCKEINELPFDWGT